jgi:hypothetical protein
LTHRLIGLLERPNPKSFGMVAIIIREPGHEVPSVCGLAKASSWRHFADAKEAVFLLKTQGLDLSALDIDFEAKPDGMVACWFGTEFIDGCRVHGIPLPDIPDSVFGAPEKNGVSPAKIWLASAAEAYAKLDDWLKKAAVLAVKRRSPEIARLMEWCLPDHEETKAALWYTSKNAAGATDKKLRVVVDRLLASHDPE